MTTSWRETAVDLDGRPLTGAGAFRLMPEDPMADGEAAGRVRVLSQGWATLLEYRWTHPQDGPQDGALLVASPEEDGTLQATLVDSWHQKPGPMHLRGTLDGAVATLHATYLDVWGWNVELRLQDGGVRLLMQNVVPEEARAMAPAGTDVVAGPYDVMDLSLRVSP